MDLYIKEILEIIRFKDRANLFLLINKFILVNGKIIKCKDMGFYYIQMEQNMRVYLLIAKNMEKEN